MDNTGYPVADVLIAYAWPIAFAVAAIIVGGRIASALKEKATMVAEAEKKDQAAKDRALLELKAMDPAIPGVKEAMVLHLVAMAGLPMTPTVINAVKDPDRGKADKSPAKPKKLDSDGNPQTE
jgi:hypothetical protein